MGSQLWRLEGQAPFEPFPCLLPAQGGCMATSGIPQLIATQYQPLPSPSRVSPFFSAFLRLSYMDYSYRIGGCPTPLWPHTNTTASGHDLISK